VSPPGVHAVGDSDARASPRIRHSAKRKGIVILWAHGRALTTVRIPTNEKYRLGEIDPPDSITPGPDDGLVPTFVCRDPEMERLHGAFLAAAGGTADTARVVFVAAEAGGGKTTLISHFLEGVARTDPTVVVATGRCDAHTGIADPYLPFREILASLTLGTQPSAGSDAPAEPTSGARRLERYTVEIAAEIGPELMALLVSGVPGLGLGLGAGRAVARRPGGSTSWARAASTPRRRKRRPPPASCPSTTRASSSSSPGC
jgi:hypothetical protein